MSDMINDFNRIEQNGNSLLGQVPKDNVNAKLKSKVGLKNMVSQNFAVMTAQDKVAAIIEWQTNGRMHPLTCSCGDNTNFDEIIIDIKDNKVAINCNKCGVKQDWIPTPVFAYYLQSKIAG